MLKERPILFSTLMVQALLAGRKMQTRRIIKALSTDVYFQSLVLHASGKYTFVENGNYSPTQADVIEKHCPYGKPGEMLWVREGFGNSLDGKLHYKASVCSPQFDEPATGWKPSIHMPKAAARIWLRVKSVRAERVQEISEADAIAEGIGRFQFPEFESLSFQDYSLNESEGPFYRFFDPVESFETLWQSINGEESWDKNPWLWVVEFEILSTTGKPENL